MDFEKYKNTMEYPEVPSKMPYLPKFLNSRPTVAQLKEREEKVVKYMEDLEAYERSLPEYRKRRDTYGEEDTRLYELFKADALEEVGLTGHSKAEKVFALAWERGHSSGLCEVFNELQALAELLLDE